MALKYKVGSRVRIKDLTWYDKNKSKRDVISFPYEVEIVFTLKMSSLCGQIVTISKTGYTKGIGFYRIREDCGMHMWTDEMIEGLVEEETKVGTALNPLEIKSNANCLTQERVNETKPKFKVGNKITNGKDKLLILNIVSDKYIVEDNLGECGIVYFNDQDYWKLVEEENKPEPKFKIGEVVYVIEYDCDLKIQNRIYKNGMWNYIINIESAPFIFYDNELKKKKKYPKTYEECCRILGFDEFLYSNTPVNPWYKWKLFHTLNRLIVCRDAYWRLAGFELGLGKPWEPDYDSGVNKYGIICINGVIQKSNPTTNWERHLNKILDFPTEEMRDAFYENFKELIEECKELL